MTTDNKAAPLQPPENRASQELLIRTQLELVCATTPTPRAAIVVLCETLAVLAIATDTQLESIANYFATAGVLRDEQTQEHRDQDKERAVAIVSDSMDRAAMNLARVRAAASAITDVNTTTRRDGGAK